MWIYEELTTTIERSGPSWTAYRVFNDESAARAFLVEIKEFEQEVRTIGHPHWGDIHVLDDAARVREFPNL